MGCAPSTGKAKTQRRFSVRSVPNEDNTAKMEFLMQTIEEHKGGINCMEISDDRSLLVTGGDDSTVRLWAALAQPIECLSVLRGHENYITCCRIFGCHLISGSADKTLRLWSIESGECLLLMCGHESIINSVICYGRFIFSTSYDKTCRVWDMHSNDVSKNKLIVMNSDIETNNHLESDANVCSTECCIRIFKGHQKSVTQSMFIPHERTDFGTIHEIDIVVTASTDCTARTWSLYNGQCIKVLSGHNGPINCVAVDPINRRQIYTGGADSVIKCWDIVTGDLIRELNGHTGTILVLLAHKRILYSGSADKTARAWVMEFGECTRTYWRNQGGVTCIKYFEGMLFTGSCDTSGRIYDAKSGILKRTCHGHENAITGLQVTYGRMFTCSYDGKICAWECNGIKLDTIFGNNSTENQSDSESDNDEDRGDSENVQIAIQALEPFIRDFK